MSFTNAAETLVLQWLLTAGAATRPTAWYVGLFTDAPTEAGTGTEIAVAGYARMPITLTVTGNTASNSASIEFAAATAPWGSITHAAVFDSLSGGTMIASGALTVAKTIDTGDIIRIPAASFNVTLD